MKKNKTAVKIVAIVAVVLIIAMLVVVFVLVFRPNDPCKNGHDYKFVSIDGTTHKQVCKRCKAETEEEAHIGNTPYESKGEEGHVLVCSKCDFSGTVSHVYDDENDGYCDSCEYIRFGTSNIEITSDKTELHPGDEFTIKVTIHSMREGCRWESINFTLGPLNQEGNSLAKDISPSFEFVELTSSLDKYIPDTINNSSQPLFDGSSSSVKQGMSLVYSNIKADRPCEEDIEITVKLKVKDTAKASSFNFGVAESRRNFLEYYDLTEKVTVMDRVDQVTVVDNKGGSFGAPKSHCMKINSIPMSISE